MSSIIIPSIWQLNRILIPKFLNSDSWSRLTQILGAVTQSRCPSWAWPANYVLWQNVVRQEPDHTLLYSQANCRAQMHFLIPWNLPGDGLPVLGAGTCWAFVALPPLGGLNGRAKSLATETGGVRHCWDFLWIWKKHHFLLQKKSGGVRSCCLTMVRRPLTRIHFSTWHCGATLNKSYNFAWSWCFPSWGELETICEAAQGRG